LKIQSMTGFGRGEGTCNGINFRIEIRSVNHRYCDINVKLSEPLMRLEQRIRNAISANFSRGKFEVSVSQIDSPGRYRRTILNLPDLTEYQTGIKELSRIFKIKFHFRSDIGLADIAALKDLFVSSEIDYKNSGIDEQLLKILDKSLKELKKMRLKEGRTLYKDLKQRINNLLYMEKQIEQSMPKAISEIKERYISRIKELSENINIDMYRLNQEIAIMVERMDITEEVVRLNSHLSQLKEKLDMGVVVGRSIDFILQEVNREINTISSKASDIRISGTVVDMKAEVERIREQVQNIE